MLRQLARFNVGLARAPASKQVAGPGCHIGAPGAGAAVALGITLAPRGVDALLLRGRAE